MKTSHPAPRYPTLNVHVTLLATTCQSAFDILYAHFTITINPQSAFKILG